MSIMRILKRIIEPYPLDLYHENILLTYDRLNEWFTKGHLEAVGLNGSETIHDLISYDRMKIIALAKRLEAVMRSDNPPGVKPSISGDIEKYAVAIAWKRSGLTQERFVEELEKIKMPWDDMPLAISKSTLERRIKDYKVAIVTITEAELTQAGKVAEEILRRIEGMA